MKVLLFNGSVHTNGSTFTALSEIAKTLNAEGVETEILQMGVKPVRDCVGCRGCAESKRCVFNDDFVNGWIEKAASADGLIFGTPVYYAHPSGAILSAMDRMFYAGSKLFAHKPAAVIACARRGGTTATLDAITKHLSICQMPIVSSTYWNMVHGAKAEDVVKDEEGMQTMRNLARNMAWLIKCIEAGKKSGIDAPTAERGNWTNFIR